MKSKSAAREHKSDTSSSGLRPRSPVRNRPSTLPGNQDMQRLLDSSRLQVSKPSDQMERHAEQMARHVDDDATCLAKDQVRIHTDSRAAEAAGLIDARAFVVGTNIYFGFGEYAPNTPSGRALLNHEMAHALTPGKPDNLLLRQTNDDNLSAGARQARSLQWSAAEQGYHWAYNSSGRPSYRKNPTNNTGQQRYYDIQSGSFRNLADRPRASAAGNAPHLQRGYAGEQSVAFSHYRAEDGWVVIDGPSGSAGHRTNAGGEDILAFNSRTGQLEIGDNKSWASRSLAGSASAIDPQENLEQNLTSMIRRVEAQSPAENRHRQRVLRLLRQTRAAVRLGRPDRIPGQVRLVLSNAGGQTTGVKEHLRSQGVTFLDSNTPRAQVRAPTQDSTRTSAGSTSSTSARTPPRQTRTQRLRGQVMRFGGAGIRGFQGIRGRFTTRMRNVGGRGIGALISLAAAFGAGWVQGRMEQSRYQAGVNRIDQQINEMLPRLQPSALAMKALDPTQQIYLVVTTKETETTTHAYDDVITSFDGISLTDARLSVTHVPDSNRGESTGSIMGSGIEDSTYRTTSIPVNVPELPSLTDLEAQREDLRQIALAMADPDNPTPALEGHLAERQVASLGRLIQVYRNLSSNSGDSAQLESAGTRITEQLVQLATWQSYDDLLQSSASEVEARQATVTLNTRTRNRSLLPMNRVLATAEADKLAAIQRLHEQARESGTSDLNLMTRISDLAMLTEQWRHTQRTDVGDSPRARLNSLEANLSMTSFPENPTTFMNEEMNRLQRLVQIEEILTTTSQTDEARDRLLRERALLIELGGRQSY